MEHRTTRLWTGAVALLTAFAVGGLTATSTAYGDEAPGPTTRIADIQPNVVGGGDAAPGQFPWMVRLSMGCGAAVVAPRVVLTAAHCVRRTGNNTGIIATIGRTRLSAGGGEAIRSTYVFRSPTYARTGTSDWALIELSRATSAPPLALAAQGDTSVNSGTFTIMGWGATVEGGPQSDTLKFASVPFVNDTTCGQAYGSGFAPLTEICAGFPQGGVDTCQGDSGGPMVKQLTTGQVVEVGIVSYGFGCARAGFPGVYGEVQAFSNNIRARITSSGTIVR